MIVCYNCGCILIVSIPNFRGGNTHGRVLHGLLEQDQWNTWFQMEICFILESGTVRRVWQVQACGCCAAVLVTDAKGAGRSDREYSKGRWKIKWYEKRIPFVKILDIPQTVKKPAFGAVGAGDFFDTLSNTPPGCCIQMGSSPASLTEIIKGRQKPSFYDWCGCS